MCQRVICEGDLQHELGKVVLLCGHVSSLTVASKEVEAERPAEIKVERLEDLDLHEANVSGRARVVSDVDKVA